MVVWFFMLLGIVVIWFLTPDALGKRKKKLIFFGLSFLVLVFVAGSRSSHLMNSADLRNYYNCFGNALVHSLDEMLEMYSMEDGYIVLNQVLAWLIPWNYFIVYFEAAFCTAVMLWFINRNTDNVFLGVIIYICLGPWQFFLTGFRQSIAMCLCLIAFEYIKKRRSLWDIAALALIVLAALIHTTAWIFLLTFLLRRMKADRKLLIIGLVVTTVTLIFLRNIIDIGNSILGKTYEGMYIGNVFGGIVPIVTYIAAIVLCTVNWGEDEYFLSGNGDLPRTKPEGWDKRKVKLSIADISQKDHFLVAMMYAGLCIYIMRYNSLVLERISFYFTPVMCPLLANGITRLKNKVARNICLIVCVCICIGLFTYRIVAQLGNYYFFWDYC